MSAKFSKRLEQDLPQFAVYILSDDSTGCKDDHDGNNDEDYADDDDFATELYCI